MQYILTQEEYDQLRSQYRSARLADKDGLQKLCTKICNEMPVKWGWPNADRDENGDEIPKPWTCMLDDPDNWYCDGCPVTTICQSPQVYSP